MTTITDAQVRELREAAQAGEPQNVLAARYGTSRPNVSMIVRGKVRTHAGGPIIQHRYRTKDAGPLTDHQIVLARLRAAQGETIRDLAAEYHTSENTMSGITTGKRAKRLPGPRTWKRAKLKAADVVYAREAYAAREKTVAELEDILEVSNMTIRKLLRGDSWKSTPGPTMKPLRGKGK